jgi:hypothetical protein
VKSDIAKAKALLEDNDYVVVRMAEPGWAIGAFRLNEEFIAIRLNERQPVFLRPKDFCDLIGIERHTLGRNLKHPDCPRVKQQRGPKGHLVALQPTPELITFLRRNKRSSS